MEYRSFDVDLEVRSRAGKRLVSGIVVPYSKDVRIDESLVERFEPGAFAHQFRAAPRVGLLNLHSNRAGSLPLGHATELRDDAAGLFGEYRIVDSTMGDHFLALIVEGSLREWSAGFEPLRSHVDGEVTVRTKASLFETAFVPEGAYGAMAAAAAVRERMEPSDRVRLTRDVLASRMPKQLDRTMIRR